MKVGRLEDMVNGWFAGDFSPTLLATGAAEAAVQVFRAGAYKSRHHHRVATEVTVIARGRARMNGVVYGQGTIIVIEPGEATDFEAIEDATTFVVKIPGASNDKYEGEPEA
ncbi:MAG: hypothetical protein QME60_00345 [Verrucomicrobiota bacterium]|nr:hypothetical protein [Verrucomicrobiota bacterium]